MRPIPACFAASIACVLFAAGLQPAHAALFRAYLSSTGSDANPCTLPAPCRLLPAALNAIDDGGEVWILDSANYNTGPVTIAKSASILAVPGALGSVVAQGGHAIVVNGANAKVALRNLVIVNLSAGQSGVVFQQGSQLAIEDCEIQGLPLYGIHSPGGNSRLVVRNSTIRGAGNMGIYLEFATDATLENVRVVDAGTTGIAVASASKATITDSIVTGGQVGLALEAVSGSTINVALERSTIRNASQFGVFLNAHDGIGGRANLVMRRSTIDHADVGISMTAAQANVSAFLSMDGNVVSHHRVGLQNNGPGPSTVQTFGNNTFAFNSQADTTVAPTGLAPQ